MRTSSARRQRGFSYLLVLFIVVVSAAGLAAMAQHVGVEMQREREAELAFRGEAIARAITAFASVKVDNVSRLPQTLGELLEDRRARDPVFHLRRLYADPFTGRADWVLLRDERGGITGVRSRSQRPLLRRVGVQVAAEPATPASAPDDEAPTTRVADWVFAAAQAQAAAAPASAASHPRTSVTQSP